MKIKKRTMREIEALAERFETTTIEQRRAESCPPTPEEVAHGKMLARRMRGRPKIGKGARNVSVSVEAGLLKQVDAMAKSAGVKRSEIICLALRGIVERKAS